jgi:hypothetical protein
VVALGSGNDEKCRPTDADAATTEIASSVEEPVCFVMARAQAGSNACNREATTIVARTGGVGYRGRRDVARDGWIELSRDDATRGIYR